MLDHRIVLWWLSRHWSARLLSAGVLSLLITAPALAGTKPSQPTTDVPADVAGTVNTTNTECQTTVVKDQPILAARETSGYNSPAPPATTTGAKVDDSPEPAKTEILQDKLWSTSLSRSSKDNEVQKAPQCGMTTAGQPPAD